MPTLEQIPLKAWQELLAKVPAGSRILGWLVHLEGFIRNLNERDPFTFTNGGRAVQTNSSTTYLEESDVTSTELGYLDGVTSGIQAQLDGKVSEASITALTDNSGPTADNTIENCGDAVTGVDGTGNNAASKADVDTRLTAIENNIADLAGKVNEILTAINA
jgi:hypothetical protein